MKKPNNTSWEALEKAWQKQIQTQESDVPANMWERMEQRMDKKTIRPLGFRMTPWVWSAAAVLALIVGLNWESAVTLPQHSKTVKQTVSSTKRLSETTQSPFVATAAPVSKPTAKQPIKYEANQVGTPSFEQPAIIPQEPQPVVAQAAKTADQPEEIWVRIDINPIEEAAKPISVAQREDMPVLTKKKTFVGRLLKQVKQVVAGEQLNWQELKEGNRSLEDGIHQVANTYYRTEQTVKQTFQIQ
ncbi:MAG: hypothetical protein RIS42_1149 [Bacteroidota bacterium]|jgi:hypothetical protein